MNTRQTLIAAALAFAASGTAFAQEATYEYAQPIVSTTTRAAVQAEVLSARANGSLIVSELDRQAWSPVVSPRSRDAVRAETMQAAEQGLIAAVGRDDNSFDGRATMVRPSSNMVAVAR